ncbi:MAG: hypothetical protein H6Q15_899 [Bacteroidetes bacterium]|nr:hypothetical protein [Bacteroidota bacterium]
MKFVNWKMNKKILLVVVLSLFLWLDSQAQFIVTSASKGSSKTINNRNYKSSTKILLPYLEDFSNYTGTPKSNYWINGGAWVNTDYSLNAPTLGVVTLDALDDNGRLYLGANTAGFSADTISSSFIRLDSIYSPLPRALSISDSLYFSFYFQPGGGYGPLWEKIGSTPSKKDSLILEFYSSNDDYWNIVWMTEGLSVDSIFANDSSYFRYVSIPITDSQYFNSEFRFRFRNFASLDANPSYAYVGNCDNWNIDYIYINEKRTWDEKTFKDIAFVEPAHSLLKKYQAMPARQYISSEMADSLAIKIINLWNTALISNYKYNVFDNTGGLTKQYDGGFENIYPFIETKDFQTSVNHARPIVDFAYSFDNNSWTWFDVIHTIKMGVGQDDNTNNDTISFRQVFENYYAYDDGTAENGFGIEPIRNSNLALGFDINVPDTLTAVDIYFNSTYHDANLKPFYLCIWNSLNDKPYDTIYRSSVLTPSNDGLNKYTRYTLSHPVIVSGSKFFVSLQTKNDDYLNIGFDRNTDASENILGNWANSWQPTFIKGSLMIRPYFGYKAVVSLEKEIEQDINFNVYPNPSKGRLNIETQNTNSEIRIVNMLGKVVYSSSYKQELDITYFNNGVYVLYLIDKETGRQSQKKIIVNK